MGYQVGRICYETEQEAVNVLMTQVSPTIDKDGVLHHAVFDGKAWKYQEQTVKLTFPQCEFGEFAQVGREIGYQIVLIYGFIISNCDCRQSCRHDKQQGRRMTPEIEFFIGMLPPFAVAICLYVLIRSFQ